MSDTIKKLENLLDKYDDSSDEISKEIIAEVKNNSKNYGEVINKLKILKRSNRWMSDNHESLFSKVEGLLEKEMNDLPLTNRSNF